MEKLLLKKVSEHFQHSDTSIVYHTCGNTMHFILSTGCDLPQEVPLEKIDAFIQTGKNY